MKTKKQTFFQYSADCTTLDDCDGGEVEYENYLVGNVEGLAYLRDRIDEVILTRESIRIEDDSISDTSFDGIALAEMNIDEAVSSSLFDHVVGYGCVALIALPIILSCLGLWKLFDLIF